MLAKLKLIQSGFRVYVTFVKRHFKTSEFISLLHKPVGFVDHITEYLTYPAVKKVMLASVVSLLASQKLVQLKVGWRLKMSRFKHV